jgi:hypothetical protein
VSAAGDPRKASRRRIAVPTDEQLDYIGRDVMESLYVGNSEPPDEARELVRHVWKFSRGLYELYDRDGVMMSDDELFNLLHNCRDWIAHGGGRRRNDR